MLRCSTKESQSTTKAQRLERTRMAHLSHRSSIDQPSTLVLSRSWNQFLPYLASAGGIHFLPFIIRGIHSETDQTYSLWYGFIWHLRWTQSTPWLCARQRRLSTGDQCASLYTGTDCGWSASRRIRSWRSALARPHYFLGISREDWPMVHCFGLFLLVLPSSGSYHSVPLEISQ